MKRLSRRSMLRVSAGLAGAALLAACAPKVTPMVVKETVIVEKEVQKEVTKVVEVQKEVTKQVEKVVTATPAEVKPVKILMWDDWYAPDAAGTPRAKFYDALYEDFRAKNPNIEIEHQPPAAATEIRKAFIAAHASGTAPDVFGVYPPSMNPYIEQGFLLLLDEYVNNWEYKDLVVDALWYDALVNGHYYGVPGSFYGMTLAWRKDLFAKEGLTRAPKNWDELVQFGKKLTKPDKKQYGFGLLGMAWASWYWENFVWQAGGEVTTRLPDGKVELTFTDTPGVVALQFYQDLKFKHGITQENVLQDYGENENDFIAGRTTMWMTFTAAYPGFIERGLTLEQFGTAPLPVGPTGIGAAQIGGGYWTINADTSADKQAAAWQYIYWRTKPETWILIWNLENKLGIVPYPWIPIYKGILNQAEFQKVSQEWVDTATATAKIARTEYVFKDKLEPYFAAPVQEVLTNPKADCRTVLIAAAKKMVSEVAGTVLHPSAK